MAHQVAIGIMTPEEALGIVRTRGVVLESGSGPEASIAEAVAGAAIRGSWWAHARGKEIFQVTRAIRNSPDVLVCRLVGGKITYVHRRLWPALVRLAERLPAPDFAQICETHTASGKHITKEIPYPQWVPKTVNVEVRGLSEAAALAQLGPWAERLFPRIGELR
jgi:hypothetical protein